MIVKMLMGSISALLEPVKKAGDLAATEFQKMKFVDRGFKEDGSIITRVDLMVESYLVTEIDRLFPGTNIVAEEQTQRWEADRPYTFALDPIDGTDSFSQGLPGWCVSLGLLNQELLPIAGIIYAPLLKLTVFADIGKRALVNGRIAEVLQSSEPLNKKSNIMVASSTHQMLDLRAFPAKIRSIGSAAVHLVGSIVYPGVCASLDGAKGRIWDIVAAHAVNLSVGNKFEYLNGGDVQYGDLVKGNQVGQIIIAGTASRIREIRSAIQNYRTDNPGVDS